MHEAPPEDRLDSPVKLHAFVFIHDDTQLSVHAAFHPVFRNGYGTVLSQGFTEIGEGASLRSRGRPRDTTGFPDGGTRTRLAVVLCFAPVQGI